MIPAPPAGAMPNEGAIRALTPALAEAAQAVYDAWEVGEDGLDPERGAGGICDLVADAFVAVLGEAGVEGVLTLQAGCGENHVFAVALLESGVFTVDISPYRYEWGGGYAWTKIPGVRFEAGDVAIDRIEGPMSLEEFEERYRD